MKTIYKSIALEAALLSVTLALQAEIQSEGETVTADVQANTLDRLKVTLVSPNVSGARDLVASGNAVIEGNEIAVNLENLVFGTHRLVVSARFGTQIRTLYALDISVPQAELPNETQEYEDAAIVVSTYGDGGGGGEFPTDYAKQGDDPTATLTDAQAYAQAAAEAAQSLIAVDADIFAGKQALATNISAKGVPSSLSDALTVMATKVLQIPQQVNTGVSEFEQMIAPSPYMWNVYAVANDLMKQTLPAYIPSYMAGGNYVQYRANNSFFVGEYYRGYVSIELTGADGYLTHDGCFYTMVNGVVTRTAPDGTVTTYEAESIVHTWLDDPTDTYSNRWVAFFYLTNAYSFSNSNANICPRRAALCGTCNSFSIGENGRLNDLYVIGTVGSFTTGDYNQWGPRQVIKNYIACAATPFVMPTSVISICLPDTESSSYPIILMNRANQTDSGVSLYILSIPKLKDISAPIIRETDGLWGFSSLVTIDLSSLQKTTSSMFVIRNKNGTSAFSSLKELNLPSLEELGGYIVDTSSIYSPNSTHLQSLEKLYMPKLTTASSTLFNTNSGSWLPDLIDVEVGEMTTGLDIRHWSASSIISDSDKLAILVNNIKNHILARVSDATGGTQLVFKVSTDMYNAIASETITWQDQTMTLADAFLTKNWLLAGA